MRGVRAGPADNSSLPPPPAPLGELLAQRAAGLPVSPAPQKGLAELLLNGSWCDG